MMNDYGCDDMNWLGQSARHGAVTAKDDLPAPVARFDNRPDKTSFVREDPKRGKRKMFASCMGTCGRPDRIS